MTAASRSPRDGLSIGAVLARLRAEFPDVTISKIRFLESEGLVRPARTEAGHRLFGPDDVERLRFVLAAQRDHYLPLKVIREQLESADRAPRSGSRPPRALVAVDREPEQPPTADDFAERPTVRVSRADLLTRADVDGPLLGELEQYGLVRADADGLFDADAVEVARVARALTDFGIEPRHLRAFRASADREVGLLTQVVAPLRRAHDPAGRSRAEETGRELAALSVTLHTLLVKAGLRGALGG